MHFHLTVYVQKALVVKSHSRYENPGAQYHGSGGQEGRRSLGRGLGSVPPVDAVAAIVATRAVLRQVRLRVVVVPVVRSLRWGVHRVPVLVYSWSVVVGILWVIVVVVSGVWRVPVVIGRVGWISIATGVGWIAVVVVVGVGRTAPVKDVLERRCVGVGVGV